MVNFSKAPFHLSRGAASCGVAVLLATVTGCASIPSGRAAIDDVAIRGTDKVEGSEVLDKLATTASPKLLGLFRGVVYDYEIFDRDTLQRDLARVERLYRARGFYDAHARAGRVMPSGASHVRVEIIVEEGNAVLSSDVSIDGLEGLPPEVALAVKKGATDNMVRGAPFDEDGFKAAQKAMKRALTDRGYAFAKVSREAYLDIVHHVARSAFTVRPGGLATFGEVTVEWQKPAGGGAVTEPLPDKPVLRAIDIKKGAPYSTADLDSSTTAVLDLGVFSAVEILPQIDDPPQANGVVPVKVRLEPSRLREVRIGGGIELDQIKTDVHLLFGWEDHNFLGGLRRFGVDFKPGIVLYPLRINNWQAPTQLLLEERLRLQFNEPGFLEARVNGFIRPELNVFPLLVKTATSPDDPVLGYIEFKGVVGADRTLWKLFGSLSENLQVEKPFTYKGDLDPALRTLVLAYPDLLLGLDFRDDRTHPHSGAYFGNDLQVAVGGAATDVKVQPEIRTYLPIAKRVTFATRASVGFLFPFNYGDVVTSHLNDPVTPENRAERVKDIQIVFFRGLFSGGSTSNRGFPVRGISPHGVVPFLNPATAAQQVAASCDPSTPGGVDPSICSIPIGGFTLWELSNELRVGITGPFSGSIFCDMGDVSEKQADLRFSHLHLSCGLGVRYETPVGPIRLDVGYRIQPLQVLGYNNEDDLARADPKEGIQPKIFGVPLAISFGIGEAY